MARLGGETRLPGPVGVSGFGTEQIVLVDPDRGALEDFEALFVEDDVAERIPLGVAVGVQQRCDGRAGKLVFAERVVDGIMRGVVDRTGDDRSVRVDIVALMLGAQDGDFEDQDLGALAEGFALDRFLDLAVVEIVQEGAQVGIAAWFVDHADDRGVFRKPDHDMPDIERALIFIRPEIETVRSRRFLLAGNDASDRAVLLVDQIAEKLPQARIEAGTRTVGRVELIDEIRKKIEIHHGRFLSVGEGGIPAARIGIEKALERLLEVIDRIEQGCPPVVAGGARTSFGQERGGNGVDLGGRFDLARDFDTHQAVARVEPGGVAQTQVPTRDRIATGALVHAEGGGPVRFRHAIELGGVRPGQIML